MQKILVQGQYKANLDRVSSLEMGIIFFAA